MDEYTKTSMLVFSKKDKFSTKLLVEEVARRCSLEKIFYNLLQDSHENICDGLLMEVVSRRVLKRCLK